MQIFVIVLVLGKFSQIMLSSFMITFKDIILNETKVIYILFLVSRKIEKKWVASLNLLLVYMIAMVW